jgi:uncharacterized membrane protein YgcG
MGVDMRLIHAFALLGIITLAPLVNPAGCSKYGEGSPCSTDNTDPVTHISDDCDDGLVCTPANMLQICSDSAICCPPPGQTTTSPACIPGAPQCGTGGNGGMTMGSNVGGFSSGGGGNGGTGGSSGPPTCPHDECTVGVSLLEGSFTKQGKTFPFCTDCVNTICAMDASCCTHAWDEFCVDKVKSVCKLTICEDSGTGGNGGSGGSGGMSSGGGGSGGH